MLVNLFARGFASRISASASRLPQSGVHLRKDGQIDRRYKNQPTSSYQKNYQNYNQKNQGLGRINHPINIGQNYGQSYNKLSSNKGPLTKDGKPDMRFSANRGQKK